MKISSDYNTMHRAVGAEYGKAVAKAIWNDARKRLNELAGQLPDLSKGERQHVEGYILPRIAVYRSMESCLGSEKAMALLDAAILERGQKMGAMLRRMTALPLMKGMFMKIFASMAKSTFGAAGGFEQRYYDTPKDTIKFDILDCTYCRWCRRLDCPEIIHTFCDSDSYCYGKLTGITFERTQTLEHGEKCDFTLIRTKGGTKQ